ncbi:MAG: serine hydrolase domain-containing protein [Bacteroidota bacterium]
MLDEKGKWYSKSVYLNEPPGKTFEYTNVGATLAAHIIEVATGEAYHDFTTKHILTPLGMNNSGWSFDKVDFSQHTKLYATEQAQIPFYSLITYPDGGLITSIDDLSQYLVELIRGYAGKGTLLTPSSYQEIFKPQLSETHFKERDNDRPYDDEYNAGIFMGFTPNGHIGHTGGDPGVSTFMFFNPELKIGRILMINTNLINDKGVQQYFSIWDKLEEYQLQLQ